MPQSVKTPIHLWIIGVVTLLWNMMGGFDYLMTQTRNEAYMAKFEPAQLEYFYGFPIWFEFFWAVAVWGGLAGSILLLLRKCLAVPVLAVSFASMVITTIYSFGLSNGLEVMGATGLVFTIVIFLVGLGLVLYSRAMQKQGVLT